MFSKKYKIIKKEDFNSIYKNGALFQSDYLKVFILTTNLGYSRLSIIVSKTVSPQAVIRNKIKRRLKNVLFGLNIPLNTPVDIIIKTSLGADKLKSSILKEKFEKLFEKIKNENILKHQ